MTASEIFTRAWNPYNFYGCLRLHKFNAVGLVIQPKLEWLWLGDWKKST